MLAVTMDPRCFMCAPVVFLPRFFGYDFNKVWDNQQVAPVEPVLSWLQMPWRWDRFTDRFTSLAPLVASQAAGSIFSALHLRLLLLPAEESWMRSVCLREKNVFFRGLFGEAGGIIHDFPKPPILMLY